MLLMVCCWILNIFIIVVMFFSIVCVLIGRRESGYEYFGVGI